MRGLTRLRRQKPALFESSNETESIQVEWPGLPVFTEDHYRGYQSRGAEPLPRQLGGLVLVPKFEARTEVAWHLSRLAKRAVPDAEQQLARVKKLCDLKGGETKPSHALSDDSLHIRRAFDRNLVALYYKPRAAPIAPKVPSTQLVSEPVESDTYWIELKLVDAAEDPVSDVAISFETTDGNVHELKSDSEGKVRVESTKRGVTGTIKNEVPDGLTLDACWAFAGAGRGSLTEPKTLILHDESVEETARESLVDIFEHRVQADETLPEIASRHEIDLDTLKVFNFGASDSETVQKKLSAWVGTKGLTQAGESGDAEENVDEVVFCGEEVPGVIYIPRSLEAGAFSANQIHTIALNKLDRKVAKLESTVALEQFVGLCEKRTEAFFVTWMVMQFGTDIPVEAFNALQQEAKDGALLHPPIRLRQVDDEDYVASYNRLTETIEVSYALCERILEEEAGALESDSWLLAAALVEEFGHHIDSRAPHTLQRRR